jgi:hypothetical protein
VSSGVRRDLAAHEIAPPLIEFEATIDAALSKIKAAAPAEAGTAAD